MVALIAPILIVDGYNIIGAWDELKKLKETSMGSARDQLIATLSAYYPWCWKRIIIVFDGQRYAWEHVDGVEAVFTEDRESADTMIEKLAAGLSG
ncbi:MAG: NYN domain-containing protein, partial [Clostridia bacterium]|nr:NYN domain-containing protein [Clostridia bacterium]